ncbi:MAG TPA: aminotransferase class V-fold PLP-dependent enzyme [Cyclobacteriaceae bacterium]|nr:aminotransferase class V-fold PLP-dependent enzyme [Cyclobacteriaceae bacterium]
MLTKQASKFSLNKGSTYLNCAYMSPLLKTVEKAGLEGMLRKRNPAEISTDDFFTDTELLRTEFAHLINTKESKRVVIIPSVSYGLANVANNLKLKKGQHVIVASEQFPSNYYPWQTLSDVVGAQVKVVAPPDDFKNRGKIWNERILDAINNKTRAVAIGHIHWADGTLFDLQKIRKRTREVGALLIIDGSQSVGALPFDIRKIQPDALVTAGYKWLLGPYSLGLAYYGEYFDKGKPIEENWINRINSENFADLVKYQKQYQPGALRYEVGEHSNFILLPMLLGAIRQINDWGVTEIQNYCKQITADSLNKLEAIGYLIEKEKYRASHLFGIRPANGVSIESLKEALSINKISVSIRGNAIRVSPHLYNDEADMKKLTRVLADVVKY